MSVEDGSRKEAQVRVLSYNFNILPRCCGGYQHERIDTFLKSVDNYDVLLLQEVYSTSALPYALQKRLCYKRMLLSELKKRGFNHYVASRQPSYYTMLNYSIVSDNGLLIVSRFPIWHCGSYTFRSRERGEQAMAKGVLFAEVEVPVASSGESQSVVFFNVHLRPEEAAPEESAQFLQMKNFVTSVMEHLNKSNFGNEDSNIPYAIGGDFNIPGIEPGTHQPSKQFMSFMQLVGGLKDIIYESKGNNPPTRPAKLFFPTQTRLLRYEAIPQRQDYFLVNEFISSSDAKLEKFVVGNRRPYTYLSDHFGVASTLNVKMIQQKENAPRSLSRINASTLFEEPYHEKSNTSSIYTVELLSLLLVIYITSSLSWTMIATCVVTICLLRYLQLGVNTISPEYSDVKVSSGVVAGKEEVTRAAVDSLSNVCTIRALWERSVSRFRMLPCLGSTGDAGRVKWLSFGAVDTRVSELGSGMKSIGIKFGDVVGVDCEAGKSAAVLDLACATYGYVTLALAGKGASLHNLIDENKIKVVFASRGAVSSLLSCRSACLETIVYMDAVAEEDADTAKDLNISLVYVKNLEQDGGQSTVAPSKQITESTVFTYVMENVKDDEGQRLIPITHGEILRDIKVLFATRVLPDRYRSDSMLWYTSFAATFHRVCALGLLANGNAVGTTSSMRLQDSFALFRPTILVASPSLFSTSETQLRRAMERYSFIYRRLFFAAFQLRSRFIHVSRQDSTLLRLLFFRPFQRQIGGHVRKIVLCSSQESCSFGLVEHITVCYAPVLQEVFYQHGVGVLAVDGAPAPEITVQLRQMDSFCDRVGIGQLCVKRRGEPEKDMEIAAQWEKKERLVLLGSSLGVLWPVDYHFAIAVQLERVFINSRYITNVFVYCEPNKSLIAIVHPNRDTVEFEWQQEKRDTPNRLFAWPDLAEYAPPLILQDLTLIGKEAGLHPSQIPTLIHLHPHPFRSHKTFFTPYGKLRRKNVKTYFAAVINRFYNKGRSLDDVPDFVHEAPSEGEMSVHGAEGAKKSVMLQVPITIDIGGTFAKLAFIVPPGMRGKPRNPSFIREASSLSDALGLRTFRFFESTAEVEEEMKKQSSVGTMCFGKIASHEIPKFANYIAGTHVVDTYKKEYMRKLRATGGGAFKYSSLARSVVGVNFEVVREMDAVVNGLNLIIDLVPQSIFTVNDSGDHQPHQLVSPPGSESFSPFPYLLINIGSGISFIKCLAADGSHVRVGGSPIGGATFWGLTRTLTDLTSWDEVLEIMRLDGPGDNKNVDLLVGDIYGYNAKDLPAMLASETVASSFGKFGVEHPLELSRTVSSDSMYNTEDSAKIASPLHLATEEVKSPTSQRRAEFSSTPLAAKASSIDIVRSLLNMIAGNVTQLAYLHSKTHDVKNIFFAGGFVRENPVVWSFISKTLLYWSSGECKAHFLEHDGYLGALGCAVMPEADGTK
uniref:Pantothenate kinase n=1 Tax=Strigomonas galati TaxID=1003336 RepID=T1YTL1_9TRYP|nr:pantothenate kinase [Strigomonas galati]